MTSEQLLEPLNGATMSAAKDVPLTLIAAMDCGELLLLAADSGIASGDGLVVAGHVPKLAFESSSGLAWAFSGDETLGLQFSDWMRSAEAQHSLQGWDTLADAASDCVGRLNAGRRDRLSRYDLRHAPFQPIDVLIAGYIGDHPEILELTSVGVPHRQRHHRFVFIGGGPHVAAARQVVATVNAALRDLCGRPDVDSRRFLRLVMEQTINSSRGSLAPPIRMLQITSGAVNDISGGDFQAVYGH